MNTHTNTWGIEVTKGTLKVSDANISHFSLPNNEKGFASLVNQIPKNSMCIIHTKTNDHIELVNFLDRNDIPLAIIYPLEM